MASKITVTCLSVDQGMGTLVRIYNKDGDKDKLTNLALLDLGSSTRDKKASKLGVDTVVSALQKMAEDKVNPPTLDLVVISHQDEDHWNLLNALKERIDAADDLKDVTTIKQMKYGGQGTWDRKAKKSMKDFGKALKASATVLAVNVSEYLEPPPPDPPILKPISGVEFRLLCTGVSLPASIPKSSPEARNAASAVVVIRFGGKNVVVPGDATAATIGWINTRVFDEWEKEKKNPVDPCVVVNAPHHGSLRTIAGEAKGKKRKAEVDDPSITSIGSKFAKYVSAKNVVASAGYKSKHSHPSKSVMIELAVAAEEEAKDDHKWVWNLDAKGRWAREPNKKGRYTVLRK